MPHVAFSPNKSKTGGAAFWKLNRDNNFDLTVFAQTGWDENNKKNNFDFKGGPNIRVKLNVDEIAGIIRAVRTNGKFNFYHVFNKDGTDIVSKGSFAYYLIPAKGEFKEKQGFGLSVTKDNLTVKVGYSLDSAENLMEFLKYALSYGYKETIEEDDKKEAEFQANKVKSSENAPQKSAAPKKAAAKKPAKSEPEPEPEETPEVNDAPAKEDDDTWD